MDDQTTNGADLADSGSEADASGNPPKLEMLRNVVTHKPSPATEVRESLLTRRNQNVRGLEIMKESRRQFLTSRARNHSKMSPEKLRKR